MPSFCFLGLVVCFAFSLQFVYLCSTHRVGVYSKKKNKNKNKPTTNHPTTALSRETNLWLTGRNIAITARKKKALLKTPCIFIYAYVITSDFFDTRYAVHSVHSAAALTMLFPLLNSFEHEQIVTLTKPKSRKSTSLWSPQLNHSISSHAGATSVFVYLWTAFYTSAVNSSTWNTILQGAGLEPAKPLFFFGKQFWLTIMLKYHHSH